MTLAIDDRTSGAKLPLPHPQNLLEQDVLRMREALEAIDAQLLQLLAGLELRASSAALNAAVGNLQRGIDAVASSTAAQMAAHSASVDALARRVRELENASLFV